MDIRRILAPVACCVMSGATALAQPASNHSLADAQLLLESCRSEAPTLRAMCLGYLAAISDGLRHDHATGNIRDPLCPPAIVSLDAYRQAFIGFVTAQPARPANLPAAEAVRSAFLNSWTCR
jgi:hypothetical protein